MAVSLYKVQRKYQNSCPKSFLKGLHVECVGKTADPQIKAEEHGESVKQMCDSAYARALSVCEYLCLRACVSEWVSELLGCIGILRCDWQGRSLLGEIVNRLEPVICSRQPWKGTADSQGSYWEFQRCCLTDLGPGPASHRASQPGLFSKPRWSMRFHILPSFPQSLSLQLFLQISFCTLTFLQAFKASFCFYFVNFAFSCACVTNCVFSFVLHFSTRQKNFS